jgi:hypothetical protein
MATLDFTFEGLRRLMQDRLRLLSNSNDVLFHSTYQRIIDTQSFAMEKLSYQAGFYFRESSFKTATTRTALVNQSFFLDYTPSRRTGAFGNLAVFALNENFTFPFQGTYTGESIVIPRKSLFQTTAGGVTLYSTEQTVYPKNTVVSMKFIDGASAVNKGSGKVGIPVTTHGMSAGALVTITGSENYDGDYTIDGDTTTNEVVIETTFIAETFQGDERIFTGHIFIPVKEGTPATFTYVAEGSPKETFSILEDNIDNDEIEIAIVNSQNSTLADVTIVDKPFFIDDIDNYYAEVLNLPDFSGINIRFGENVNTRQLSLNERVRVSYIRTLGANGNVSGINAVTVISADLTDAFGNPATLYVRNIEPISDGQDFETIESIRNNARRLFFAGRQLVSKNDWVAVLESHPSVAKAIVWSVADLDQSTTGSDNNIIFLSAVTNSGDGLTAAQETDISINFLIPRKSPTDIISWQPLQAIFIKFMVEAVIEQVPFTQVQAEINTDLNDNFDILNVDFAQDVFESNYTRIIDLVGDVIRHTTIAYYVEADVNFQASLKTVAVSITAADNPDPEEQILLSQDQVQLWIKRKIAGTFQAPIQIAQANGSTFDELNSYRMGANTIVYSSNQISYQLQDLIDDTPPDGDAAFFHIDLGDPAVTAATALVGSLSATSYNIGVTGVVTDTVTFTVDGTETTVANVVSKINGASGATEFVTASFVTGTGGGNAYILVTLDRLGANTLDASGLAAFFTDLGTRISQTVTEQSNTPGSPATLTFGVQDPTETDDDGYILYLMYRTEDGNGDRQKDIRLRDFNQILDFDDALTEFELEYDT